MDKKLLGRWGEEKAAEYLRKKGCKVIGLNYSCRFGEIDIIAEDGAFIVFVEVKLRASASFAAAREAVNSAKQQRLISAAELWLSQNPTSKPARFDVMEVYAPQGALSGDIKINRIEDAFSGLGW